MYRTAATVTVQLKKCMLVKTSKNYKEQALKPVLSSKEFLLKKATGINAIHNIMWALFSAFYVCHYGSSFFTLTIFALNNQC